jgi:hypothetical protein
VPPRLPRAALAEALPAVEDACKSDVIPFTRPRARPAHRGRGGRKGKGRVPMAPLVPTVPEAVEDICRHNDDDLRAYCFCCPALRLDEFQCLYSNPPGTDQPPVLSTRGKSAQDIFGECILRKNKGEKFVRQAGTETAGEYPLPLDRRAAGILRQGRGFRHRPHRLRRHTPF